MTPDYTPQYIKWTIVTIFNQTYMYDWAYSNNRTFNYGQFHHLYYSLTYMTVKMHILAQKYI